MKKHNSSLTLSSMSVPSLMDICRNAQQHIRHSHIFGTKKKPSCKGNLHFLWDMHNKKCCNGFYIQFRQTFAKETFSYDEHLISQNIQY